MDKWKTNKLKETLRDIWELVTLSLVVFAVLGGVPALILAGASVYTKKQDRICVESCQPQKVVGVQAVGVLGGTIYYYELEDGGLLPSNDKSIRIGDEACECSKSVVKLNK